MKKLFTMAAATLVSAAMYAQVTVTYQVDITPFLNDGGSLAANGIRIGGNFVEVGSTLPSWTPIDDACGMTSLGDNVWSISIEYPASSVGQTQLFKFVNGDWGSNEGTSTSAIADDGCGTDDGAGNINRTFVIPAANETICFQWDLCAACASGSIANNAIESVNVYPNPAKDLINFQVALNGINAADVVVTDLSGRVVSTSSVVAGTELNLNIAEFAAGTYIYSVVAGESVMTGKFNKQ